MDILQLEGKTILVDADKYKVHDKPSLVELKIVNVAGEYIKIKYVYTGFEEWIDVKYFNSRYDIKTVLGV